MKKLFYCDVIPLFLVILTIFPGFVCAKVGFVTDGLNKIVYKIDTDTNAVTAEVSNTFTPFFAPWGVAITPDGLVAYVTDYDSQKVYVIDTATNAVTAEVSNTFTAFSDPVGIAITPDGLVAFLTGLLQVYAIDTVTNAVTAEVSNTFTPFDDPVYIAITPPIFPPQNLTANQKKNDFGIVFELYNQLKWKAPFSSANVVGYYVYRNGTKIATLDDSTFEYQDHNRKKGEITLYSVTSFNANGDESTPVNVTVK